MSSTTTTRTNQVDEGIELAELFGGSTPPQRVEIDTTLRTPVLPPAAHTRSPTSDHRLPNIQTILSSTNNTAVIPDGKKTWFSYVVEYAPVESMTLLLELLVTAKWAT